MVKVSPLYAAENTPKLVVLTRLADGRYGERIVNIGVRALWGIL